MDLSKLVHIALSSRGPEEILGGLADALRQAIDHDWVRICLYPRDGHQLHVRLVRHNGEQVSGQGIVLSLDNTLPGQAILTGSPIVRDDILKESVYRDERDSAAEARLRSLLVVPLPSRGRVIGTLELGSEEPSRFGDGEVAVALDIASDIGILIEHVWLLEESEDVIKIEERMRMAREIHDTVVQSLITIVLQLELAERRLRTNIPVASLEIKRASGLARHSLEDARRLVLNLEPPALEQLPLSEALTREVKSLEASGIEAQFSLDGSPLSLPGDAEVALYRITQELVANIRKHANAGKVKAALEFSSGVVRFSITDDGAGFDPSLIHNQDGMNQHFGLAASRERAALIGGDLNIESAPGRGTTVKVRIPTTSPAAEGARAGVEASPVEASTIQVIIVEDHELTRHGIKDALASSVDISIVGEAENGDDGLEMARRLVPDIAILDVRLPGLSGIEVTAKLEEEGLPTRSIILSAYKSGDVVVDAMRAGAKAYLMKDSPASDLAEAIRAVHRGEILLGAGAGADLMRRVGALDTSAEVLTPRELEVLSLIGKGLQNKEIGRKLCLTEATIKYHVTRILGKLGVSNRTEALSKAIELHLIRGD